MATMFPGKGQQLYLASSNAQEPVWASMRTYTAVIPDGSFSLGQAVNPSMATDINVEFASAPAATAFEIRYDVNPDFSTEYVLDTVAASGAQTTYTWSTADNIRLSGFLRIKNTGGQNISGAWLQETSATVG